jgi:mono/diheme cytochrome c family protein
MKKSTQWAGVFAMGIISAAALSGCTSADPGTTGAGGAANMAGAAPMAGSGTTAGAGTTAGSGMGGSAPMGTQLKSPQYFTILSGADATAGAAAPAGYGTAACSSCHGPAGAGTMSLGPEIRFTPKEYAVAVVRNGRKNPDGTTSLMAAYPATSVSDADLDAIATWLNSLPKPTTGQGLYKAMCGNCHGPNMATGGSAPVSIQGKPKSQLKTLVRNGFGTDVTKRAEYMPKYDTTLLTDAELDLIAGYLGSM